MIIHLQRIKLKKNHHEITSKSLFEEVPAHLGDYRTVVSRGSRNDIGSKRTVGIAIYGRNGCLLCSFVCHYWLEVLLDASLDTPVDKHGSGILCCRNDDDCNSSRRLYLGSSTATYVFISYFNAALYLADSRCQLSDFEEMTFVRSRLPSTM